MLTLFWRWRQAVRFLGRRRSLTVIAGVTLASTLGVTTALFSLVDAALLHPLPWPDARRLTVVFGLSEDKKADPGWANTWNRSALRRAAWRALQESDVFEEVGAWQGQRPYLMFTQPDSPSVVSAMTASSSFLAMLGLRPAAGRLFSKDDDDENTATVLLSHETWLSRFGGRSDVLEGAIDLKSPIGRTVVRRRIVGVLEPQFSFGNARPDIVLPIGDLAGQRAASYRLLARLRPDMTREASEQAAAAIVRSTDDRGMMSARLVSLAREQTRLAAQPLLMIFCGAAVLLVIGMANVAALMLHESGVRQKEFAIRSALGGSGRDMFQQLLLEQLSLVGLASAAGLLVAGCVRPALTSLVPDGARGIAESAINGRVVEFVLVLGLGAAIVTTIIAASVVNRGVMRHRHEFARRRRPQVTLVASQVALTFVLVVTACLLGETFLRLTTQPLGFDTTNLVVLRTQSAGLGGTAEVTAAQDAAVRHRLESFPGVVGAASVTVAPFEGEGVTTEVWGPDGTRGRAMKQVVSPNYLDLVGIKYITGRLFSDADPDATTAVVSRQFERQFGEGILGRTITAGDQVLQVVGVVDNVARSDIAEDVTASVYVLSAPRYVMRDFLVRGSRDMVGQLDRMRRAVVEAAPSLMVTSTDSIDAAVERSMASERFYAVLSSSFALASLGLAAVGVYGLTERRLNVQKREVAIRFALGASSRNVTSVVLSGVIKTTLLGLAVGLPCAVMIATLLRSLLYGVTPDAARVYLVGSAVLTAVAVLPGALVAHRARALDPARILRHGEPE